MWAGKSSSYLSAQVFSSWSFLRSPRDKCGPLGGCGMSEGRFEVHFIRSTYSSPVLTKTKVSTEYTSPAAFRIVLLTGYFVHLPGKVDTSRVLKFFSLKNRMVE